jgi:hypothetical protein
MQCLFHKYLKFGLLAMLPTRAEGVVSGRQQEAWQAQMKGQPSRARKERDPNWNRLEMIALVCAKRAEFMEELQVDDPRELMSSEMTKWERVSLHVNTALGITYFKSIEACKYKWQTLLSNYKQIADLHKETRTNSMLYFELTFGQRRERNLPKNFDSYVYQEMHE